MKINKRGKCSFNIQLEPELYQKIVNEAELENKTVTGMIKDLIFWQLFYREQRRKKAPKAEGQTAGHEEKIPFSWKKCNSVKEMDDWIAKNKSYMGVMSNTEAKEMNEKYFTLKNIEIARTPWIEKN